MTDRIFPKRIFGPVALLALLSMQCQSEKLEPDVASTPPEMQDGFRSSECATCLEGACPAELDGCTSEPACASAYDCLGACSVSDVAGSGECAAACVEDGQRALEDLVTCLHANTQDCCAGRAPEPGAGGANSQGSGGANNSDAAECQPVVGDNACVACTKQQCCESRSACIAAQPQCLEYENCLLGCQQEFIGDAPGTAQCIRGCEVTAPNGLAPQRALNGCVLRSCLSPCGVTTTPAVDCFLAECPDTFIACQGEPACWSLQLCITECAGSAPCSEDCLQEFPEAKAAYEAFVLCASNNCADAVPGL